MCLLCVLYIDDYTIMTETHKKIGKVFRIGTVHYHWPMSAHASQAFSIAHCTDSEDLPKIDTVRSEVINIQ